MGSKAVNGANGHPHHAKERPHPQESYQATGELGITCHGFMS